MVFLIDTELRCTVNHASLQLGLWHLLLIINLVIVLIDISNFVMSGGILFKMLVLGINEMVYCLSSEVLKGYSLFLIYKTNIFVKLLKIIWCQCDYIFFVIYFCDIWAFSSSRKHLLITLLKLEFVVLVLYFSIYLLLLLLKVRIVFGKKHTYKK